MSKIKENLIGRKFYRWLIIEEALNKGKQTFWKTLCDCGAKSVVQTSNLKNGGSKSCGCWKVEYQKELHTIHGLSEHKLYGIHSAMKSRCLNPNNDAFSNYGGRGIKVCDRWLGPDGLVNFYKDMGSEYEKRITKGEKISLDRYPDVNGNYELTNVRWATSEQQNRNMRTSSKSIDIQQHRFWRHKLSNTVNRCIRKEGKSPIFLFYVGLLPIEFKQYIKSLWLKDMSWDNYGKGIGKWQLDHIIGCNNFDLSLEEDRLTCFNYKNLQPLWDIDHKKKSTQRIR